jgi:lipopolysaccharide cholinephosphotransferase
MKRMEALAPLVLGRERGSYASVNFLRRIEPVEGGGYRPMDRDIAGENLRLFKQAMDAEGLAFFLFFGTLLGAVRDKDFIAHDYDTDTAIMAEDRGRLLGVVPRLLEAGFEFARCKNEHYAIFTFMRRDEFIDVYPAAQIRRIPRRRCWNVDGSIVSYDLLTEFAAIDFLGEPFRVPRRFERTLAALYGRDWRREKRNFSALVGFDYRRPLVSAMQILQRRVSKQTRRIIKRILTLG